MGVYILVISTSTAESLQDIFKATIETKVEYPDYIEKILNIGLVYVAYTIYKIKDESKLSDSLKIIGNRYYKIAKKVPAFEYSVETAYDVEDIIEMTMK